MESFKFGRDIPWRANGTPVIDAEDYAKNTLLIPLSVHLFLSCKAWLSIDKVTTLLDFR